jgi:hypothetical protein
MPTQLLTGSCDVIETTTPTSVSRTYRPGRRRARLCGVPIPFGVAAWLHRNGVR